MQKTIIMTATVYAYAALDDDTDERLQIEHAKAELRRKLRLLNDTPSEVFCEYEIDDEPVFDLQRFAVTKPQAIHNNRKWKPTTAVKRAIKKYLRAMGIDEKTNEYVAEGMIEYYNRVMTMKQLPSPPEYFFHDMACREIKMKIVSVVSGRMRGLSYEKRMAVWDAFRIFRETFE